MALGRTTLSLAIIFLVILSSGCISDDEKPTVKVAIDVMGGDEQNVVQGNNTTFLFAIENNWKENATLVMSAGELPKDWEYSFIPESIELKKHKGSSVRLNISVPSDETNRGFDLKVTVKGQGSDVHIRSKRITVFVLDKEFSPELNVVDEGDTVYVNYTGFLSNGTVFDTTDEEIATDFRIGRVEEFQGRSNYEPQPFHPARGELVQGFDEGFANMRAGETKSFFIQEEKAYSIYEEVTINLTDTVALREEWTTNDFNRAFRQEPAMWMTVTHRKWNWTAQVVSIADDEPRTVTLEMQVNVGDTTEAFGWESEIISIDSSANEGVGEIVLLHKAQEDSPAQLYNSTAPKEFDYGEVIDLTSTTVTVRIQRSHHDLAGEDLIFVVKIDSFQE
jgi:FKBP-type peptidyl-prolyl cis-trans isomerase 2